jgi:hypothetical protein
MKEILLNQSKVAFIDEEDYERVNKYLWCVDYKPSSDTYFAFTHIKGKKTYLHSFILNTPKGLQVDHKDHDGLNDVRNNIRICTQTQNNANNRKMKNTSSKYKGVSWTRNYGKWEAYIKINKIKKNLGYFTSEKDATLAYNKTAIKLFGEFALLNIIEINNVNSV